MLDDFAGGVETHSVERVICYFRNSEVWVANSALMTPMAVDAEELFACMAYRIQAGIGKGDGRRRVIGIDE